MKRNNIIAKVKERLWSYLFLLCNSLPFLLITVIPAYGTPGSFTNPLISALVMFSIWPLCLIMLFLSEEGRNTRARLSFLLLGITILLLPFILLSKPIFYIKEKLFFLRNREYLESLSDKLHALPVVRMYFEKNCQLSSSYTFCDSKHVSCNSLVSLRSFENDKAVLEILTELEQLSIYDLYIDLDRINFEFNGYFDDSNCIIFTKCPEKATTSFVLKGRLIVPKWYYFE